MAYRRLKGDLIFDGERMHDDKVLLVDEQGTVIDLVTADDNDAEKYQGILCPGLINSHCHLELSHMKGRVLPGKGMVDFLISVVHERRKEHPGKLNYIRDAEKELWEKGVNGVADICNTTDTIEFKKSSKIRWHNLVEVINFYDSNLDKQLAGFKDVKDHFEKEGMHAVLTPHAPYSVSAATYDLINEQTAGEVISIHNQESATENDLFKTGKGDFLRLYGEFGDGHSPFAVTGTSSIQHWLPQFTNGQTILLVHNSFISGKDIEFAFSHAGKHGLNLVFCLCPNANLFIEGVMPPVELLINKNCTIVVGTDSYSSNYELSIMSELKTLKENFPMLKTEMLLKWATSNGADAMRWNDLGRFKKGTRPGVVAVNESDFSISRII